MKSSLLFLSAGVLITAMASHNASAQSVGPRVEDRNLDSLQRDREMIGASPLDDTTPPPAGSKATAGTSTGARIGPANETRAADPSRTNSRSPSGSSGIGAINDLGNPNSVGAGQRSGIGAQGTGSATTGVSGGVGGTTSFGTSTGTGMGGTSTGGTIGGGAGGSVSTGR